MSHPLGVSTPDRERRSYFRVSARLPLRHRVVHAEEIEAFERDLTTKARLPLEELDPPLRAWFERLERKLDRVLALLDPHSVAPLGEADTREVVLSGSGVGYCWPDAVPRGQDVLIELLLPGDPPRPITAIGRVVRCRPPAAKGKEGFIAVEFRVIDESDRESIVRFTYQVQRAALRARRQGEPAR